MKVGILGGGLSGVVMAYILQGKEKIEEIDILEKENVLGGLCRSFNFEDISYDIGPHILFSKTKRILNFMLAVLYDDVKRLRRSNRVYLKGRFIKYPFENDLYSLSEEDRTYCLDTFVNNPYSDYAPDNLLKFFLTTFGEGITNTYLRPYNEKMWKYDPSFLDTQMVGRIPKPPAADIIKSANGIPTEGYQHQLYFYYPKSDGISSLVRGVSDRFSTKVKVQTNFTVTSIEKERNKWKVNDGESYDRLISTIPLSILTRSLRRHVPIEIMQAVSGLLHNSLIISALTVRDDLIGDHLAILIPDKEVIFHRLSKLNFLMPSKKKVLLAEITYRKGDAIDCMTNEEILERIVNDLIKLQFLCREDYISSEIRRIEYAYVIYDLLHKRNTQIIRDFYNGLDITLCGRFGEHEYLNMDTVIENCGEKAKLI